jgi:hypothetical protein
MTTPLTGLARAMTVLTSDHDPTDALTTVLMDARDAVHAAAAGMLLDAPSQGLEVVAATSHAARELELLQAQELDGPCVEAMGATAPVVEQGERALEQRWPRLGALMTAAGYGAVQAHALRWQGVTLGAMNFFHLQGGPPISDEDVLVGQSFADAATLAIVVPRRLTGELLAERAHEVLEARKAIEYAKGVLMHRERLDAASAFDRLVELAGTDGETLMQTARRVIGSATNR